VNSPRGSPGCPCSARALRLRIRILDCDKEQIDQSDPCKWLVVGREIAVPDPESGTDRWSLDLFFVDHNAKPTLIECKRFQDTRSRREVVAQMLDYAANANYYWSKEDLRAIAELTASAQGDSLESQLANLTDDEPD